MEGTWFSGVADELARCVTDAQASAEACEALLESVRDAAREDVQRIARTLVPQAAIARVLIDLIDQPPQLVLAACKLCSDSARDAIRVLERSNGGLDVTRAVSALRASAESCDRLVEAVS